MKKSLLTAAGAAIVAAGMAFGPSDAAQAKTIGVALASDTNPFYIAMLKAIKARAKELGYDVSEVNAQNDIAKQLNGVNDLIAKKVSGILISPIDAKALCSAYDKASAAGIPMMSIARGSACKSQTLHVSVDEIKVGTDIANWTAKKIGGKGKVAVLAGPAGAQAFINFAKGYEDTMKKYPGIKVVFRQTMILTRENGLKYGEDSLVAHSDLAAIYGANDEIGLGAAQAAAAAGKKKQVVITGMNGVPPAIRAVKQGKMDLTVSLNPFAWGKLGVDTMDAHLKGKKFDKKVFVGHVLVDSTNVDKFIRKKK
ncbi:MAG: substrate-binding domain-containing protein [Bauldia litoralis]